MICRFKLKVTSLNVGLLSAAILCFASFSSTAEAANGTAPEKLSELEKAIVGSNSAKLPIELRLKHLELKVFAKLQAGSLTSRISALEKFAGIANSDYMPPLPPQFDNGKEPVKKAPERAAVAAAKKEPEEKNGKSKNPSQSSKISAKDPQLSGQLEEAIKLHHQGKEFEAERSLKTIIDRDPKNADAYFSLGAIAETKGDMQAALEYYTLAMQANPNDSEACEAVAELSRKITASTNVNAPFVNPLAPPPQPAANVLQGRALALNAASGATNNNLTAGAGITGTPSIPTLGVSQPSRSSAFARVLARAALGAALSGTGLHCPVCHMMRGF